eukprot:CAMPEP_0115024098 /NCGR_PEP_ID=MMETSP0216-20121206/32936_1 /TAXON_ID=223996 /ORGANISM="Protocruzia adherens, Strain Boccale" /LENGTH=1278 /DNA_ID=CAMNT_0002397893 /DNA_START=41 /DNA_END=3877 /DNA_ORIENTATION=+
MSDIAKKNHGDEQELQSMHVASATGEHDAKVDEGKKVKDKPKTVPLSKIFGVLDTKDKLVMYFSLLAAFLAGTIVPLFLLLFGETLNSFGPDSSRDEMFDKVAELALITLYIGFAIFVACYFFVTGIGIAAERVVIQLRRRFFASIMNQEVAWFDENASTEFASKVAQNSATVQNGLGDKLARSFFQVGIFVSGMTIALVKGLRLAGVITATLPVLLFSGYLWGKSMELMVSGNHEAYQKSGGVAEETLSAVKTVAAFNCQEKKIDDFCQFLAVAKKKGIEISGKLGAGVGLMMGIFFVLFGLAFYYGGYLIEESEDNISTGEKYQAGDIITVLFAVLFGIMSLGEVPNHLMKVLEAQISAADLFEIIDRKGRHDEAKHEIEEGNPRLKSIQGDFEFKDVDFSYPTRKEVPIFKNLNLKIEAHKTTAIVGETGSGKSTIIQLVEKFYKPDNGTILLDGINLEQFSHAALRSKIGLVSQEPVLFATSIEENLKLARRDATMIEIRAACEQSQAASFIENLPDKYSSYVGQGGSQLSGGQKQRIAIARALLKNPAILLLDEATSALDNISEKEVQKAVSNISRDITQIIIAHRLTTIQKADKIVVIKEGGVWEEGTHDQLINLNGVYANLAAYQTIGADEEEKSPTTITPKEGVTDAKNVSLHVNQAGTSSPKVESETSILKEHDKNKNKGEEGVKKPEEGFFGRVWALNKPEQWALYLGSLVAFINGSAFPISGMLIALSIDELLFYEDGDDLNLDLYVICFVVLGVVNFVVHVLQYFFFAVAGENLTLRIRRSLFKSILKMPVFFFDKEENRSGALVTMLESQASAVKNASGPVLGTSLQSLSSLLFGLILAFIFSWRMSLVLLALAPFFIIGGAAETAYYQGSSSDDIVKAYEQAGSLVSESIGNVRTIYSFSCQDFLTNLYFEKLEVPRKSGEKNSHVRGAGFGFSQFAPNVLNGVAFLIGAAMIREDWITFKAMSAAIFCITFGAYGGGQAAAFAPDANEAATSCKNVFRVMDRESEVDPFSKQGSEIPPAQLRGEIHFSEVNFKYESRDSLILNHFNLEVLPGQSVALVGPSGCGKSTVIQLLLRFYLPMSGSISIDGVDISTLNIGFLRTIISLVSQEPVLFDTSIEENIRYGNMNATKEEIIEAARVANALDFIEKDSTEGFNRTVGVGGKMLSGGQKQRVAIARAVLRNPTILLLDEATSALDNESEQKVQDALNNISKERSTVVIAHRISTISDCDKICVINHGKVVEEGRHEDLLMNQGLYSRLVKALR